MIWFQDPVGFLFTESNWFKLLPHTSSTIEEQLNALVMFALYFMIGIIVMKGDIRVVYLFLFICFLTWIFYNHTQTENFKMKKIEDEINIVKEPFKNTYCVRPTKENPFMNVMMKDIIDFPNRPPACNISKPTIKEQVDTYFDEDLPRELGDVYHKNASDRQFFTMPNTTIPNNTESFVDFVYKMPPTRKQLGQNF
jgi:hypothetical protein